MRAYESSFTGDERSFEMDPKQPAAKLITLYGLSDKG
jgi:hypothetical protein